MRISLRRCLRVSLRSFCLLLLLAGVFCGGYRAGFYQGNDSLHRELRLAHTRLRKAERERDQAKIDLMVNRIIATISTDSDWIDVGEPVLAESFTGNISCSFSAADVSPAPDDVDACAFEE